MLITMKLMKLKKSGVFSPTRRLWLDEGVDWLLSSNSWRRIASGGGAAVLLLVNVS